MQKDNREGGKDGKKRDMQKGNSETNFGTTLNENPLY